MAQRPQTDGNLVVAIASHLKASSLLGLTDANDVAYSYIEDEDNYIVKDKSVKDKIDELTEAVANPDLSDITINEALVVDDDGTTVHDKIVSLLASVATLEENSGGNEALELAVALAQQAATTALTIVKDTSYGYYVNADGNVVATYNGAKYTDASGNEVLIGEEGATLGGVAVTFVKGILTIGSEYVDKIDDIMDIANTFSTGFDADADIAIVSEKEYNEKLQAYLDGDRTALNENTVYMCYDSNATKVVDEDGHEYPVEIFLLLWLNTNAESFIKEVIGNEGYLKSADADSKYMPLSYSSTFASQSDLNAYAKTSELSTTYATLALLTGLVSEERLAAYAMPKTVLSEENISDLLTLVLYFKENQLAPFAVGEE